MSTQGGLKHAVTEPTQLDTKRERRRGAAGRAAVLRRAPSDSDCSGETASLSADSGERAARPPPPAGALRSGKSRSRRRGSEWEVLEGLKDGQRFDRRPEVFNGYLHKKRKWPLKGWHKRFFVVDGGILVYARSPTDVARGRLHGSVDVGLSVISAKARRRRIDIDADEFIYHLRAKTPDVFRTWLNVLKVHRLYRQHLLTFGARESVPKIHAPLEDLPPTDTSSRTSLETSLETTTSMTSSDDFPHLKETLSPTFSQKRSCYNSLLYKNASKNPFDDWCHASYEKSGLMPLNFEPLDDSVFDFNLSQNRSMCSMNCVAKRFERKFDVLEENKSPMASLGTADTEKQIHSTVLNENSSKIPGNCLRSSLLWKYSYDTSKLNDATTTNIKSTVSENFKKKFSIFFDRSFESKTALFFFAKKKSHHQTCTYMKKSKKCTNLVKYRNLCEEPPLKKPLSRSMLLGKYKLKMSKQSGSDEIQENQVKAPAKIEGGIEKKHKSLQDVMTTSEYDKITERLILSIFNHYKVNDTVNSSDKVKYYITQIVRELYEIKLTPNQGHPVKKLFRSLLEYWLKNTSIDDFKGAIKQVKSIDRQSNKYFTKDEQLSSEFISYVNQHTQYHGHDFEERKKKTEKKRQPDKNDNENAEKERRIQELERLLKSTVYICETVCSSQSKEKDIKITKKLIDNLEKYSKKCVYDSNDENKENSNSSTELPKIQDTINHLISETSIPPDVAKEFLGAYLDVLLNDSSKSSNDTTSSSVEESNSQESPVCDVQTESVMKKVSKSITTLDKKLEPTKNSEKKSIEDDQNKNTPEKRQPVDPGQLYLKDILDKITTMFSKTNKPIPNSLPKDVKDNVKPGNREIRKEEPMKDELGRSVTEYPGKNLISENHDDNSVVIDLSKYDLENISMFSDPAIKGMMSITIKLKEKPHNFGESKRTNLNLKFSDDNQKPLVSEVSRHWLQESTKNMLTQIPFDPRMSFKNPYIDYDPNVPKEKFGLKPYLSSSDATSKAYCRIMHESEHSLDFSIGSSNSISKHSKDDRNEETQSCYMMSSFKKSSLVSKLQNKKVRVKECNCPTLNRRTSPITRKEDATVFDNPSPRIIDETFILMLLENLTLLSKSVPGLHKDIKALYVKLRKKHEKVVKNTTNIQGVGLLGKIYNDENKIPTDDNETQFDANICPDKNRQEHADVAVNTSYSSPLKINCSCDKSISAYVLTKDTKSTDAQTEETMSIKLDSCACKPTVIIDQENSLKYIAPKMISYNDSITTYSPKYGLVPLAPLYIEKVDSPKSPQSPSYETWTNERVIDDSLQHPGGVEKKASISMCLTNQTPSIKSIEFSPNQFDRSTLSSMSDLDDLCTTLSTKVEKLKTLKTTLNRVTRTTSITSANPELKMTERAVSNYNCFEQICTKDCAISTAIKCVLDPKGSCRNFRFVAAKDIGVEEKEMPKRAKNERKQSSKVRQDLIKEIRLLSPSFKVSTLSQTDKHLLRYLKSRKIEKDFKVYQLFVCNKYEPAKSISMTDSSLEMGVKSDDLRTIYRCSSDPSYCSGLVSPTLQSIRGPQASFVSGTPGGRLASWIIESGGPLESASRELGQAQLSVQQLQRLLDALEMQHQHHHDTDVSVEGASPNVKKDRRKFGLRKKKSNSKCASVDLAPPPYTIDPSSSHMALSALTAPPSPGGGASSMPNSAASLPIACAAARPQSLPGAEALGAAAGPASLTSLTPDQQLREDFTVLAKDLLATLKGVVSTLVCERGRLRAAMDAAETQTTPGLSALRTNLSSALQQNSELRSRLSRIHDASDLAEISSVNNCEPQVNRPFNQQSLSYSSSCVSASEFFDAEEHEDDKQEELLAADEAGVIELDGDSSSEAGSLSSEEGSASSDNSEVLTAEQVTLRLNHNGVERPPSCWTRRTRLPCPRPTPGGPSLWNLLYKNIGKDLSLISMPVTINEPLNMLQRLCEELEYSELLDTASECMNSVERMALVAAFAVSAYASSAHRAASKPFNPLLAETYECVRGDRAFQFIAEQVSHHPPISACHAESPRWVFWQEARIKTKFWGKSMEFQPTGRVHVRLSSTGDHYSWNKVTTCVHNLFGGQRWVDQYGDMHITCHGTDISCKLNFIKASSWSSSRHEVRGAVTSGSTRLRLQGRWSEALYAGEPPAARCLWRPGAMPPEHELYYGFTRFAMELNELEPGMKQMLPHTDTRLRPDQRALEEGDVEAAEQFKHELEQSQRDRRRDSTEHTAAWFRKAVEGGEETWVFTGEYWKAREAGFPDLVAPRIW